MKNVKLSGTGHGVNAITTNAWQQHNTLVEGYLHRRLTDPMLAEDLTQETFVRLHRAQPELREPARGGACGVGNNRGHQTKRGCCASASSGKPYC